MDPEVLKSAGAALAGLADASAEASFDIVVARAPFGWKHQSQLCFPRLLRWNDGTDRFLIDSAETFVPSVFVSFCPRREERVRNRRLYTSLSPLKKAAERTEEERAEDPFTMTTMANHVTLVNEEVLVEGWEPLLDLGPSR